MFVSGEYRELLSPQTKLQVLYPGLRGGGEGPLGRPHDVELPDDAAVHPPALGQEGGTLLKLSSSLTWT